MVLGVGLGLKLGVQLLLVFVMVLALAFTNFVVLATNKYFVVGAAMGVVSRGQLPWGSILGVTLAVTWFQGGYHELINPRIQAMFLNIF